jgi:hypothetical protein
MTMQEEILIMEYEEKQKKSMDFMMLARKKTNGKY